MVENTLLLNESEKLKLNSILLELEKIYSDDYSYAVEFSIYCCKCSGPAQSCAWH